MKLNKRDGNKQEIEERRNNERKQIWYRNRMRKNREVSKNVKRERGRERERE